MSITGKFEFVSSENFRELLKAAGISDDKIEVLEKTTPSVEITESGAEYTMKTAFAGKTTEITFTLGKEFDENVAGGKKSKSTITKEGDKLIHLQKIENDISTTTREFDSKGMKTTYKTKGVTATITYKRL